jgi:hypothetical protein
MAPSFGPVVFFFGSPSSIFQRHLSLLPFPLAARPSTDGGRALFYLGYFCRGSLGPWLYVNYSMLRQTAQEASDTFFRVHSCLFLQRLLLRFSGCSLPTPPGSAFVPSELLLLLFCVRSHGSAFCLASFFPAILALLDSPAVPQKIPPESLGTPCCSHQSSTSSLLFPR